MTHTDEEPNRGKTNSSQETIEIEADVLRSLAWGCLPEMPKSHIQSFHPEIDERDVVIHGLKSYVEQTSYDSDEEMIYFSGETEVTVPADPPNKSNATDPPMESWPIYFGVALYPTGVGGCEGPAEVYLDIEEA